MRNRFIRSIGFLAAILIFSSAAIAQTPQLFKPGEIWQSAGGVLTLSDQVPPRTPAGEKTFNANKPSYGPRAIAPALGNDPVGSCDPLGLPRILFYRTPIEFIQIPGRVFQFFERTRVWREIWTDGREVPKDAEPAYMGHSVGRWEGDTFVVNSLGFDARTWLDHFGNPHSDQMRLEERWRRVDNNTLELTLKLEDAKVYTKPWVSEKKTFRLQRQTEFEESFCIPSEEQEFNQRIRNPAAGLPNK